METIYLQEQISRCEDIEELRQQILPLLETQQRQWSQYFQELLRDSGCTKSKFASLCGVSRVSIDKWCKGAIPRNRETFLRIGLAANLDTAQMNLLLQRYGRYPALYSKSLEDCICLYVLSHNEQKDALQQFHYIRERIAEKLLPDTRDGENISTVKFDEKLSDIQSRDMLEQFIADNTHVFSFSYHKLYAYIKMFLSANDFCYAGNVFELAETQGWSSSLRQCVSAIRQNKWYPTRNKIISLGLHLCMDHDQIDEMLKLAHMEPLCAKNIFESVIMFILDDAELNGILDDDGGEFDPDGLCEAAKEVFAELNLREAENFIAEISEIDNE